MKQSSAVFLLLLLAAAAGVQAAEIMPMFVDWIAQQQDSTKAKTVEYEDVETETACLQETKLRNCRCLNEVSVSVTTPPGSATACQRSYTEVPATCCGDSTSSFMAEKSPVALCTFTDDRFLKPDTTVTPPLFRADSISYDGTTGQKLGTFSFSCDFDDDSERCGTPLCGGMTITGQGDILSYDKIAFMGESALDKLPEDESCSKPVFNAVPARIQSMTRAEPEGAAADKVEAKAQYAYDEDRPKVFYTGRGTIYSGTFSVTSRSHSTKYKSGQIQLAYPTWTTVPEPEDYVRQRAYVARNSRISLEFIKQADTY